MNMDLDYCFERLDIFMYGNGCDIKWGLNTYLEKASVYNNIYKSSFIIAHFGCLTSEICYSVKLSIISNPSLTKGA